MKIIKKKSGRDTVHLELQEELVINEIKESKNALGQYLDSSKDMTLDLSGVTKIDTAGFQLLMLIRREIEHGKRNFSIINPSAEVARIFNLYGEKV